MKEETNLYDEYLKDGGAYKQDICGECGEDSEYIKWLENKIKNLSERSEPPHPLLGEARRLLKKSYEELSIVASYDGQPDISIGLRIRIMEYKKLCAEIKASGFV